MSQQPNPPAAPDFLEPEPFNVVIGPETSATPHVGMPVIDGIVPNIPQVITPDRDLYPPRGRGVRPQGIVRYG